MDAVAFGLSCSCGEGPAASGMGHVAEALLNGHVAPVLLVRPGMRAVAGLKRLVVPLEGSPSVSAAMRAADDALCARGREIVMLHVVTGDTPAEIGSMPAPRMMDQEHYEWRAWQDEFTMRFSSAPRAGGTGWRSGWASRRRSSPRRPGRTAPSSSCSRGTGASRAGTAP